VIATPEELACLHALERAARDWASIKEGTYRFEVHRRERAVRAALDDLTRAHTAAKPSGP
jgi:hypothetical protein